MVASSFGKLHSCLAFLVGIYMGINLSGLHTSSSSGDINSSSSTFERQAFLRNNNNNNNNNDINDNNNNNDLLRKAYEEVQRLNQHTRELEIDYSSTLNQLHQMEESCSVGRKQQQRRETEEKVTKDDGPSSSSSSSNSHPLCQHLLPSPTPTAMAIWNDRLLQILDASRIPNDHRYQFHDFTTQLLQIITPRLSRSVKTIPYDWKSVERALSVGWERYQYLQLSPEDRMAKYGGTNNDDNNNNNNNKKLRPPRPLKMLIMGGSLLVGTNCRNLKKELDMKFLLPKRDCTWSNRVGEFLNAFVTGSTRTNDKNKNSNEQLIDVVKVAMGGTNTATGSVIWKYDLIPPEARDPDIVLNAYSTNDMHILTILEAQSNNVTLRDLTFDMIQNYVRQILQPSTTEQQRPCSTFDGDDVGGADGGGSSIIPPLLLHIDDYLGNEQRKIWETTELSQGVQVLASYYGFATMSYADVVRDLVYGDTYETWLSSEWWKEPPVSKKNKGQPSFSNSSSSSSSSLWSFEREIHPGMGMHVATTWVVVYNLLHLATTYCSLPTPHRPYDVAQYEPGLWGLPTLRNDVPQAKGKPKSPPKGLPPILTKDLLLEDVTSLWRDSASMEEKNINSCREDRRMDGHQLDDHDHPYVRCPFSWMSGLSLQQNNQTWIQEYFERRSRSWDGWTLSEDGEKLGFVPTGTAGSTAKGGTSTRIVGTNPSKLVLDFSFSQRIRSITIFYMKSYGIKWKDSQLEARLWLDHKSSEETAATEELLSPLRQQLLEERHMWGTHRKNTSELYTEEIVLKEPVQSGGTLLLEVTLVGGDMFKIMGLAVCS